MQPLQPPGDELRKSYYVRPHCLGWVEALRPTSTLLPCAQHHETQPCQHKETSWDSLLKLFVSFPAHFSFAAFLKNAVTPIRAAKGAFQN